MYFRPNLRVPWDLFIFFVIVFVGFTLSIEKIFYPEEEAPLQVQLFPSLEAARVPGVVIDSPGVQEAGQVIKLGCLEKSLLPSKPFASFDGVIRVQGKICSQPSQLAQVSVRNITNGYEGTIFRGIGKSFFTDHLVLQTGRNLIEIAWTTPNSTTVKKLTAEIYQK